MRYVFFVLLSGLFISGCSYKYDNLYKGSRQTTEQAVANTKKVQILKDARPVIFATVTYMDSLKNKTFVDKNKEQFVVGVHYVNEGHKKIEHDLSLKDVLFKIDGETDGVSVEKLKTQSPILRIIPASTPWSQYFLVQTPKIDKNIVKFSFKIRPFHEVSLDFEKDF